MFLFLHWLPRDLSSAMLRVRGKIRSKCTVLLQPVQAFSYSIEDLYIDVSAHVQFKYLYSNTMLA